MAKRIPKNTNFNYYGQHDLKLLHNFFFAYYSYYFWVYKARALVHFISSPDSTHLLKYQGDNTDEKIIEQGLKMELHMTGFHSTETLFRIFYAMLYYPELPWIGMAECQPPQLNAFIKKIKNEGISSFHGNAKEWVRINVYPTIQNSEHEMYQKTVASCDFIIDYVELLAQYFSYRDEYNAYKHGMYCFPQVQTLQAFEEQTGTPVFDTTNDVVQLLEISPPNSERRKKVQIAYKSFSTNVDYLIIITNSAILHNVHNFKAIHALDRLEAKPKREKVQHGYYYFDDKKASDIFLDSTLGSIMKFKS